jgi:hypothetical protein
MAIPPWDRHGLSRSSIRQCSITSQPDAPELNLPVVIVELEECNDAPVVHSDNYVIVSVIGGVGPHREPAFL